MHQVYGMSHDAGVHTDYEWQRPYVHAVLETDRSRLEEHIAAAEMAIQARVDVSTQKCTSEELQAIGDAIRGLDLLRREIEQSRSAAD